MNLQACVELLLRMKIGTLATACVGAFAVSQTKPLTSFERNMWDLCETVLHFRIGRRR
jgi:hypothetical protein